MRIWTSCAVIASLLFWTIPELHAQDVETDPISALRFSPALGAGNYAMVDGAWVGGHLVPSATLVLDYAHRPVVLTETGCPGCDEDRVYDIVSYQFSGHLGGTLTLFEHLQVGLQIPLVATAGEGFHASRDDGDALPVRVPGGRALAFSDPRLSLKAKLYGPPDGQGLLLAAVVYGTAPVGRRMAEGRSIGTNGLTAGGHLVGEWHTERFRIAANLGGTYKPRAVFISTATGPELTYGAAGALTLTSAFTALAELTGTTRFSGNQDEGSAEVRGLGQIQTGDISLQLGLGVGLVGGVGVPIFRGLAAVMYVPQEIDADKDGIRDNEDRCPAAAEDMDGYLDEDGCPEADNDADGLDDFSDRCPDEPEDMDGVQDDDGCPDLDNDGDQILDGYDSCPLVAEDYDGDRDDDGCPDDDRDRDGVGDSVDQCPDAAEDTDGFADEDGCPEIDFDGDSIPDDEDQCPEEPENVNGYQDEDGCPDS